MVTTCLGSPGRLGLEPAGQRVMPAVARLPSGAMALLANLERWARSAAGRNAGLFAVIAGAYVVGAELAWHRFSSGLAFGCPPSGVDVAALLLIARRRWPVVIAAIVVCEVGVDLQHHLTLAVALGAAQANVVEPVAGASFVGWFCAGRQPDLGTRLGLGRFLLGAAGLGPVAGGLIAHLGLSARAAVAVTQAYIAVVVLVGWVLAQEVAARMSAVQDRDSARLERAMAEARSEAAELGTALADAATVHSVGDQVSA